MNKSQLQIGKTYRAKVNGNITLVRLDEVGEARGYGPGRRTADRFYVTNLKTGRRCVFKSAQKFLGEESTLDLASRGGQHAPSVTKDCPPAGAQPDRVAEATPETTAARMIAAHGKKEALERANQYGLNNSMGKNVTGEKFWNEVHAIIKNISKATSSEERELERIENKYSTEAGATETERERAQEIVTNTHPKHSLAAKIAEKKESVVDLAPHIVVEALAGTGKTTTLVEGLKRVKGIPSSLVPSPQQAKVWEAMELSRGKVNTIGFVAFNKSIKEELARRVPAGCDAMTLHGLGNRAVCRAFGRLQLNDYRVADIISELLGRDIREIRRDSLELVKGTEALVSLCKQTLLDVGQLVSAGMGADAEEQLARLASQYDIELNGSARQVFALVPRVLERCKDVQKDNCMDFDDMIWLPIALDLPLPKYDLLLVDEAQDLNRCQQQLALRAGRRLVLCGDANQAIYGFAGADSQSLPRMKQILSETDHGVVCLPLTVTRRCGKAIVKEAQSLVPEFEAFEANGEGKVTQMEFGKNGEETKKTYHSHVLDGDFILCRVNAPLVSQCFRFIKQGRKANIQGRDIGQGLISTIKKMKTESVPELVFKLSDWLHSEVKKENAKRNPSEARLIALQDRYDCLVCFTEGAKTVSEVTQKIERVFTDSKEVVGIRLSSIHRAKGLEAKRVFFLMPEGAGCPHPMAKTAAQKEQEWNLLYVGQTRAIEELIYVR